MKLEELKQRPDIKEDVKIEQAYRQFNNLLTELATRDLTPEVIAGINKEIKTLNDILDPGALRKQLRMRRYNILNLVEKKLKIVSKNYYRNMWLAIGMGAFGVPLGVALGLSLNNMGLIVIGMPIGLVIGIAIGTSMDKKAAKEGRQLEVDLY